MATLPQFQPLQVANPLQQYATMQNILATQEQRRANLLNQDVNRARLQSDLLTSKLAQARQIFTLAPTPDALAGAAAAQFDDPVLAPVLTRMGLTRDSLAKSVLDRSATPDGFNQVKQEFVSTADQMSDLLGERGARNRMQDIRARFAPRAALEAAAPAAAAPLTQPADQLPITATTTDEGRGLRPEVAYGAQAMPVAAVPAAAAPRELPAPSVMVGAPPAANALAPAAAAAPINALTTPPRSAELTRLNNQLDQLEALQAAFQADGSKTGQREAAALTAPINRVMRKIKDLEPKAEGADIQGYRLAQQQGFKGSFVEYQQAKRPVTKIELPPQEKAEKAERGKLLVKQYEAVSDAARLAQKTLPALDTQAKVLDKGFETGFGTDAKKAAASVLGALGVPEASQYAADAQMFLAATQQAVLTRQLEQKGPQTESDAQRITQTGAQLGNTREANRFIIDVARAQLKRDLDQRSFYDSWWKKNKTYDGAEDAWFSGEGGKSLFDRPELKKYAAPAAAPATAPAAAQVPAGAGPYSDPDKERRYQEWKRSQGMK